MSRRDESPRWGAAMRFVHCSAFVEWSLNFLSSIARSHLIIRASLIGAERILHPLISNARTPGKGSSGEGRQKSWVYSRIHNHPSNFSRAWRQPAEASPKTAPRTRINWLSIGSKQSSEICTNADASLLFENVFKILSMHFKAGNLSDQLEANTERDLLLICKQKNSAPKSDLRKRAYADGG